MKILLLSAVLLALAGCGGGERVDAVRSASSASSVGAASSPALPDGSGWVYSGVVDEMRGKTSYMAKLRSVNRVDIGGGHDNVGLDLIFGGYEEYDFPIALFRLSDGEFAESCIRSPPDHRKLRWYQNKQQGNQRIEWT